MKEPIQKNNKGFTLVELLVVIGLLGVSIGVTNDILTSLVRSYSKTQVKNELEQQANFLGLKLEREIRSASDILSPLPGNSSNTIIIQKDDNSTVTYFLDGDVMKVTYSGGTSVALPVTSNSSVGGVKASCSGNCFTVVGTNPKVVTLNISMVPATGSGATFSGTATINTTITVRNSYTN